MWFSLTKFFKSIIIGMILQKCSILLFTKVFKKKKNLYNLSSLLNSFGGKGGGLNFT